jgi:DNA-binding GntR family transcriptional regulator
MALVEALDRMEDAAGRRDNRDFYRALLDFTEAGIGSTKNTVLFQVVMSIMPNLQRLQYIAIMLKSNRDDLKDNCGYFETIIDALNERNPDKGVAAIDAYIRHEKDHALSLVEDSPLAVFLVDEKE